MNTDKLFHEYFQAVPQAVFELAQIEVACSYEYISPVVKASERRLDGFLKPQVEGQPYFFLEIQGYNDSHIYWRSISQLGLSHEQNRELDGQNWQVIIFFLDESYDPGPKTLGPLYPARRRWLTRKVLPKVLAKIDNPPPILNVLLPLAATSIADVEENGAKWVDEIRHDPTLNKAIEMKLISLLVQFIGQKFVDLPKKEIDQMLQLTPFEQTAAGKDYIEEGLQQGLQQARREDILETLKLRFEQVGKVILTTIEKINDVDHLKWLFTQAITVESLTQFENLLQEEPV
ncbi:MAG: DUF2887 domain-containing protein [Chloroflexota bacterium]